MLLWGVGQPLVEPADTPLEPGDLCCGQGETPVITGPVRYGPRSRGQNKGVRNRKTTFLHQCTRNRFLTPDTLSPARHCSELAVDAPAGNRHATELTASSCGLAELPRVGLRHGSDLARFGLTPRGFNVDGKCSRRW